MKISSRSMIICFILLFIFIGCAIFMPTREGYVNTYSGPEGNSITISGKDSNKHHNDDDVDNNNKSYNSLIDNLSSFFGNTNSYSGPRGGNGTTYQGNNGQKGTIYTGPRGNTNINTSLSNSSDNYSHYSGTNYPLIYYGPNGGTARIIKTDNQDTIVVTTKDGHTDIYYIDSNNNNNNNNNINVSKFYGPNGGSAKMITTSDGQKAVEITGSGGNKIVYAETNNQNQPSDEYDNVDVNTYSGPSGGQAVSVTGPNNNSAVAAQGPNGNTLSGNTYDSNAYYNSLPSGIPKSQIADGDDDLYILKSQVVPPVCPKCPDPILKCPGGKDVNDVPPCPPCARCPEPAFDCKKVPNYSGAGKNSYLPQPVLNDCSTFGM